MARAIYRLVLNRDAAPDIARPDQLTSDFIALDDPSAVLKGIGEAAISLWLPGWKWGDTTSVDTLVLLCQLAALGYSPIVEFGTFRGKTTYNLALNSPQGPVITIDSGGTDDSLSNLERINYPSYTPGELFQGAAQEIRSKIHLLIGDSRELDLTPYYNSCGLVFVDGGHSYEVCKSDSVAALRLVRPGGVVIWDDAGPFWPGVQRAVGELSKTNRIYYLRRLAMALLVQEGGQTDATP